MYSIYRECILTQVIDLHSQYESLCHMKLPPLDQCLRADQF